MKSNPSNSLETKRGILVFAHGSSDPDWTAPARAVANALAQKFPNRAVGTAYLERAHPDFLLAATQMAAQGVTEIILLPLFLGVGKHLKQDLPEMIAEFLKSHPHMQIHQLPAVGQTASFADWVATLIDAHQG